MKIENKIGKIKSQCGCQTCLNAQRGIIQKGAKWDVGHNFKIAFLGGSSFQVGTIREELLRIPEISDFKIGFTSTLQESDIRISFNNSGNWSYIGKGALRINKSLSTMNFYNLDKGTIRHEFGHGIF